MSEELDLVIQSVRRFVRREIWLQERRVEPNAPRLPVEIHAALLERATELGLDHLMAPRGADVGPDIDLPDADRLRIAEELSQHRAGVLNPSYGLFDPDPPPQLYAATPDQQKRFLQPLLQPRCNLLPRPRRSRSRIPALRRRPHPRAEASTRLDARRHQAVRRRRVRCGLRHCLLQHRACARRARRSLRHRRRDESHRFPALAAVADHRRRPRHDGAKPLRRQGPAREPARRDWSRTGIRQRPHPPTPPLHRRPRHRRRLRRPRHGSHGRLVAARTRSANRQGRTSSSNARRQRDCYLRVESAVSLSGRGAGRAGAQRADLRPRDCRDRRRPLHDPARRLQAAHPTCRSSVGRENCAGCDSSSAPPITSDSRSPSAC